MSERISNALANVFVPRRIFTSTLDVTSLTIQLPDLPGELERFVIAHVTDLHVGEATHWVPRWSTAAADAIRRAQPDAVVNTGDFIWKDPPALKALKVASQFVLHDERGPSPIASIAILGNHDYCAPEASRLKLMRELRSVNITVLTNEALQLHRGGRAISFVGLTDEEDGFEEGLEVLQNAPRPRIALVHVPDLVERMPVGSADLVLSGHTHGGQVTVPFLERAIVRRGCGSNYVDGLYTINDMPVYVNRGLGYTGYPVRFRARPEVALIRLTR